MSGILSCARIFQHACYLSILVCTYYKLPWQTLLHNLSQCEVTFCSRSSSSLKASLLISSEMAHHVCKSTLLVMDCSMILLQLSVFRQASNLWLLYNKNNFSFPWRFHWSWSLCYLQTIWTKCCCLIKCTIYVAWRFYNRYRYLYFDWLKANIIFLNVVSCHRSYWSLVCCSRPEQCKRKGGVCWYYASWNAKCTDVISTTTEFW